MERLINFIQLYEQLIFNNKLFGSIHLAYKNALTKQSNNAIETSSTRPNKELTKKKRPTSKGKYKMTGHSQPFFKNNMVGFINFDFLFQ